MENDTNVIEQPAPAPVFVADIALTNLESSRIASLMAEQRHVEKLAAELTQSAEVLKQAVAMLLATIIGRSGGDPGAPYALADNGRRLIKTQ